MTVRVTPRLHDYQVQVSLRADFEHQGWLNSTAVSCRCPAWLIAASRTRSARWWRSPGTAPPTVPSRRLRARPGRDPSKSQQPRVRLPDAGQVTGSSCSPRANPPRPFPSKIDEEEARLLKILLEAGLLRNRLLPNVWRKEKLPARKQNISGGRAVALQPNLGGNQS